MDFLFLLQIDPTRTSFASFFNFTLFPLLQWIAVNEWENEFDLLAFIAFWWVWIPPFEANLISLRPTWCEGLLDQFWLKNKPNHMIQKPEEGQYKFVMTNLEVHNWDLILNMTQAWNPCFNKSFNNKNKYQIIIKFIFLQFFWRVQ